MKCSIKILLLSLVFFLVTVESDAQCFKFLWNYYDNDGRKLTGEKLSSVRAVYPLLHAIQTTNVAAFKSALKNGVDVNARDYCGNNSTALMLTLIVSDTASRKKNS